MKQKEKLNVELLSVAIRQAVSDLVSCEKSLRYDINMIWWHSTEPKDHVCSVCLSGATMACRVNADHGTSYKPEDFPRESQMLLALDDLRRGYVLAAGSRIGLGWHALAGLAQESENSQALRYLSYHSNPRKFKRALLGLADELEAIGL